MSRSILSSLVVAAALTLVALAPATATAQQVPNGARWGQITGEGVRVRSGSSTQNASLFVADRDQRVVVLGAATNGWVPLQAPSTVETWVSAAFVERNGDTGTVSASSLTVRLEGNADAFPLGSVRRGTTVSILGSTGGWLKIAAPAGVAVYVHRDYVRVLGAVDAAGFAAYLGGQPVPVATRTEVVANTTREPTGPTPEEQAAYRQLVAAREAAATRATEAQTAGNLAMMESAKTQLESVRDRLVAFAGEANDADLAESAHQQARGMVAMVNIVSSAIDRERQRQADVVRDREAATRAATDATAAEAAAVRTRNLARLLYQPNANPLATGVISDARDADGRKVYILVADGQVLYRLQLGSEVANVDLRTFWHRSVHVHGRVVTIAGEDHSRLVLTSITAAG